MAERFEATFVVIGGQSTSLKCACGSEVFMSFGDNDESDEEYDKRVWTCQDCGAPRPEDH